MTKKVKGLLAYLGIYLVGVAIGVGLGYLFRDTIPVLANFILSDAITGIYIFTLSSALRSATLARPYWELSPLCMLIGILIWRDNFTLGTFLLFVPVLLWTLVRLGIFFSHFTGLREEDPRDRFYRDTIQDYFPLFNFFVLQMLPLGVVYLASIPLYNYAIVATEFSPYDLIGEALMYLGILIEFIAGQDQKFLYINGKAQESAIPDNLYRYSRYPQYLGEILFFLGIFLTYILHVMNGKYLYWLSSPFVIILYFTCLVIPLEEKFRKSWFQDYHSYQKKTSLLLLWPPKR